MKDKGMLVSNDDTSRLWHHKSDKCHAKMFTDLECLISTVLRYELLLVNDTHVFSTSHFVSSLGGALISDMINVPGFVVNCPRNSQLIVKNKIQGHENK